MFVRVLSHTNTEWNRSKSERDIRRNRSFNQSKKTTCSHNSSRKSRPKTVKAMSSGDIIKQKRDFLNDERKLLTEPTKRMHGEGHLTVEIPEGPDSDARLHTSTSMTSLNLRVREKVRRVRRRCFYIF